MGLIWNIRCFNGSLLGETMRVKIFTQKIAGEWGVKFTIGNQSFSVRTFSETKKEAEWHKKMLRIALNNIKKNEA